jgi:cyclic pyranopterin phosphate synthase
MVAITHKPISQRQAVARCYVNLQTSTLECIQQGQVPKGDVFAVARIAGIMAAKQCAQLIPLCHPLALTQVEVTLQAQPAQSRVCIEATVGLDGKTGAEMEALTAVSVAALTLYDMCKALDKGIVISETRLMSKTGGKSGDWHYQDTTHAPSP